MKVQPVELNHARNGFRTWGGNGVRRAGEGDVGEVRCLLTAAFVRLLLCLSVGRLIPLCVHFERSSFAFLGSFLLRVTGAEHGIESRWAECTVGVCGG